MLNKIIKWFKGYIIYKIYGVSKERFIGLCIKNNLNIWNISDEGEYIIIASSRSASKEIERFAKKAKVNLEIKNKIGLPYIFFRYRKRKLFILGLILFLGLIYSFSFFVWDIKVSGEDIYTDEQIINKLKDYNIEIGCSKNKIDCSQLEKQLRNDFEDISWISCEIKGTRLNICINETIPQEGIPENTNPCNIVAVKDGLISEIYIKSGTKVRNKGDEVKKGDILITGAVNLYNDYDELIETSYVPANGNVYAVVSYDYYDSFPLSYYEKEYTGNVQKSFGISFSDKTFELFNKTPQYDNYDILMTENKLKLGSYFYLPISIKKNKIAEYEPILKTYSDNEAKTKARKILKNYIDDLNKKGVEILENNVKIEVDENECRAQGSIITKELIGVPADITIINQGEDN